jgi:hypothetical protein
VTVWDLEGKYLCEEYIGEQINDIMCTESGDTVITGKSGVIIIWKFIYEERVIKFRDMFKDRLLKESLTGSIWLDESVVKSPPALIHPNTKNLNSKQINFNTK